MTTPQPDKSLVPPVEPVAEGREALGPGRQHRADLVVASRAIRFHAAEGLFIAVIDGGDPPDGQQDRDGERSLGVADAAGEAGDVVVPDEGQRHEGIQERVVAVQAPIELEEVLVEQAAPYRLPQLVLGQ